MTGKLHFAEVRFYFRLNVDNKEKTLALVSVYSPPDAALLEMSSHTLWSCIYQDDVTLKVIDAKAIVSVVAMVPHQPFPGDPVGRFFVVEKPGLDVAHMGGNDEQITNE